MCEASLRLRPPRLEPAATERCRRGRSAVDTILVKRSSTSAFQTLMRTCLLFIPLVLAWLVAPIASKASEARTQAMVVIVAAKAPLDAISKDELRLIFQTKRKAWPDGSVAIPFNLPPDNALRKKFDSALLGLEPNEVARYWIDRRIRGGDRPPRVAPSSAMMVRVVSALPGAVGYVEPEAADSSVKVIATVIDGEVTPR